MGEILFQGSSIKVDFDWNTLTAQRIEWHY